MNKITVESELYIVNRVMTHVNTIEKQIDDNREEGKLEVLKSDMYDCKKVLDYMRRHGARNREITQYLNLAGNYVNSILKEVEGW